MAERKSARGASAKTKGHTGSHRTARVEREIRDVVSTYLVRRFQSDIEGMLSVTKVIVSGDLRTAKVYVTLMLAADEALQAKEVATNPKVLAGAKTSEEKRIEAARKEAVIELKEHAFEVQSELATQLQMRYTPKITFYYDEGFEQALKVDKILRNIGGSQAMDSKAKK